MGDPAAALAGLKGGNHADLYETLTVDEVQVDGTVNVRVGDGIIEAQPIGNLSVSAGDRVFVVKHPAGWVVLGSFGHTAGTTAPKDDSPPATPLPKAVINPNGDAVYQSGHRTWAVNDGHAVQGSANGYPPNTGGWFYGTKIKDAAAGRSVASASIWLERVRSSHGNPRKVPVPRIGLHDNQTAPANLTLHDVASGGVALGLGGSHTYTLTAAQLAALTSAGGSYGLGVTAVSGNGSYIQFTPDSGVVTLTFNS